MDDKRPRYLLDDSIIGSNPGIIMYYLSGLGISAFSTIFDIILNYFLCFINITLPKVLSYPSINNICLFS
jgi:hypothetical protein